MSRSLGSHRELISAIQHKWRELIKKSPAESPIQTIDLEKTYESCFFDNDTIEDILESKNYKHESNYFKNSQHVGFLAEFKDNPDPSEEELKKSSYYRDAMISLERYGHFRQNTTEAEVLEQIRYFLGLYKAIQNDAYHQNYSKFVSLGKNHSTEEYPTVVKIHNSDHYMVCDGHHRLACYYVAGKKLVKVRVLGIKKNRLQAWDHVNQCY